MGEIRRYICSCGYEKEVSVGAGLSGCSIPAIKRFFPEDTSLFLKEKEAGNVTSFLLENALASCDYCCELVTVPYFHYHLSNRQKRSFFSGCPNCKKMLFPIEDTTHISCPKCGKEMNYIEVGDWD